MIYKQCSTCLLEKPLDDFCKNSKGLHKRSQKCKECSAKVTALYRKENYNKVYAQKFKATESEIAAVLSKEVCEICGITAPKHRRHAIDHCHITGKIRGLLCDTCNKGLGLFYDDLDLLQKAINYLRNKYGT